MKYRKLKIGEIIRADDLYLGNLSRRWRRADSGIHVGVTVDSCHTAYRRPLKKKEVVHSTIPSLKSVKAAYSEKELGDVTNCETDAIKFAYDFIVGNKKL